MKKRKRSSDGNGFDSEFGNFIRALSYISLICLLSFLIFVVLALFRISASAFDTYDSLNNIPHNEVGLLLGTSSKMSDGNPNPFFTNRIRAAAMLYRKGKIDYVLVSGDNQHISYNEPRQMTNALIKAGVPKDRIVSDYAGFSTIDSVARANKVFMLKSVTIISQEFHNERALFIAKNLGMEAIAFNASDPKSILSHYSVYVREFFARIKCIFDIYFWNTQPTFLGDPIQIGNSAMPKEPSNAPKAQTGRPKQPGMSAYALKHNITKFTTKVKEQTDAATFYKQQQLARQHLQDAVKRDENTKVTAQQ